MDQAVKAEVRLLVEELGSATKVARALGVSDRIISHVRSHGCATERTLRAILRFRNLTGEELLRKHATGDDGEASCADASPALKRARPVLARFAAKFPWKGRHTPMERKCMLRAASHLVPQSDPALLTTEECHRVFELLEELASSVHEERGDGRPHIEPRMASPANILALAVRKFEWDEQLPHEARERVARAAAILLLDSDAGGPISAQTCTRVLAALQDAVQTGAWPPDRRNTK